MIILININCIWYTYFIMNRCLRMYKKSHQIAHEVEDHPKHVTILFQSKSPSLNASIRFASGRAARPVPLLSVLSHEIFA